MLFNSGLSVLRSFQTSPALEQCLLNDKSQQGPLLFDLSLDAFLGRFKTIRFFGSKQDGYTPQESACLCYTLPGSGGVDAGDTPGSSASSPESLNTSYYSSPSTTTPSSFASSSSSQNESLVHSMQQNMMQSISNSRDCRVFEAWNVNFKTMGRTSKNGILDLVDSFSGRKAHIALLDEAMFSDLCVMLNDYHV